MTLNNYETVKAEALAKLERIQLSPSYRSCYTIEAIEAFSWVKDSAFAGGTPRGLESPRPAA